MTIIEALEEVNNSLSRKTTFIYVSSMQEANLLADTLLKAEYPVCFILPVVVTDTPGTSGVLKSEFPLNAYFLDRDNAATIDFKATEVEKNHIAPMRTLAREFLHKLNEHSIIDPESKGIQARVLEPEYGLTDAHLFGVFVRAQVPVMEGVTGCV